MSRKTVLSVRHVTGGYRPGGLFHRGGGQEVLHDVSFEVYQGEILGLVGESGTGKSTLAKIILGMIQPEQGEVIHSTSRPQMIFQDPYSSLNPAYSVEWLLEEPLRLLGGYDEPQRRRRVEEMLSLVELPKECLMAKPSQLSGGQRQRVSIARSLILRPKLIFCDEPVSALDVSIQAQILNLMQDLQEELRLTYLFITHDLSVVKYISNDILVMYLGQMVEKAPSDKLFSKPMHPYTQALLSAIPVPDPDRPMSRITMKGEITSPVNPEKGCRFAKRCPYATAACTQQDMVLTEQEPGHFVTCLRLQKGEI